MIMLSPTVCDHQRKCAVTHSPEFMKKGLGSYSLDGGFSCGHNCTYCSTPSILRTQSVVFKDAFGKNAYEAHRDGYAVIDTDTPNRIADSVKGLTKDDTVIMSPKTDLWCPTSRQHDLGKKCLKALLEANSVCQVRLLSKCHLLANDLKEFTQYKDRIQVGFSLTAPRGKSHLAKIMEPNASTIIERLNALRNVKDMGFRVYVMACPAVPGILTDASDLEALLSEVVALGPEAIYIEGLNGRGKSLGDTEKAFRLATRPDIANRIVPISTVDGHEAYVEDLINTAHAVALKLGCVDKMKYLVYDQLHAELKDVPGVILLSAPGFKTKSLAPSEIKDDPNKPIRYIDAVAQADLEKSIRADGILQPLHVREDNGKYILVAGTRRLLAAKANKMKKVPVLVVGEDQAAEVSLKENLLREDLGPIELAEGYKRLMDEADYVQKDLVDIFGKVKSTISETLSLNNLPKDIKDACRQEPEKYRLHHLKVIAKEKSEADMLEAFKELQGKLNGKGKTNVSGQAKKASSAPLDWFTAGVSALTKSVRDNIEAAPSKDAILSVRNELLALKEWIESLLKDVPEPEVVESGEFENANSADVPGGVITGEEPLHSAPQGEPVEGLEEDAFAAARKKPLSEQSLADFIPDFGLEHVEQGSAVPERGTRGAMQSDGDKVDQEDEDDSDDQHELEEEENDHARLGRYGEDDDFDPFDAERVEGQLSAKEQANLRAMKDDLDPFGFE